MDCITFAKKIQKKVMEVAATFPLDLATTKLKRNTPHTSVQNYGTPNTNTTRQLTTTPNYWPLLPPLTCK